ncbi:MAG: MFS transporter permease [Betaproteobacteria bacterium HGW-Betaproteobacteria-4]|jgi:hypothetical protein|nr:MAG: MFS transporter permease [Betaproteobacteria bacterium HGW-Betaproteobacteria-4]
MSHPASQQLNAIHAMLAVGHRNLRIERHSLLLWGIPTGLLFAISEHILTPAQVPDNDQRALAWLAVLVLVSTSIAVIDWLWTRRVKQARDEAWSFIHRQVQKIWWLLMGLAVLTTFAMFFYGGGYMLCTLWLVVLGISLYLHGLFSEELLEWVGGVTIVIGIGCLLAQLPYETMRWIAATVFGFGLPLLAMMLDRGQHRPATFRLGQMLLWLAVVLVLPLWLEQRVHAAPQPDAEPLSLEAFRSGQFPATGFRSVSLPAGTRIPVEIELGGDIFETGGPKPVLPLVLNQPIELMMRDGKLTGDARFAGESWQLARQVRWISIPWMKATLTPEQGPVVTGKLIVQLGKH